MMVDDRDREVLEVLSDGRANPLYIREQTGIEKGDVNTILVQLCRTGRVVQITRGLYEITEQGEDTIGEVDRL